jgi:hypothetical protein
VQPWLALVVVGTAIWVAVDAGRLGAKRGALGGGLLDMGPASWFFACLLLWIVALPCYLATRPKLVRRARVLAMHPQFAAPAHGQPWPQTPVGGYAFAPGSSPVPPHFATPAAPAYPPAGPPPGYYPAPDGQGTRWWDGMNWAPRDT